MKTKRRPKLSTRSRSNHACGIMGTTLKLPSWCQHGHRVMKFNRKTMDNLSLASHNLAVSLEAAARSAKELHSKFSLSAIVTGLKRTTNPKEK